MPGIKPKEDGYNNKFIPIVASDLNGQVPEWVQVFPLGIVKSTKGDFIVDAESINLIINWFKSRGNDLVIDYEHQTLGGDQAPAAGWIKTFEDRGADGLWAQAEWTPKARGYIENKEYRYFSPVVLVRKSDGKAAALHSIGLTNTPAISGMKPIINKDIEEDDHVELLKQLALALGLDEQATEEQVITALKDLQNKEPVPAHKEILDLLDLKEDASLADIKGKVISLKNPSGYVKAEDFMALKEKLDTRDRDELVNRAIQEGKITPAQKAWAEQYALKDQEGFKAFVDAAPQVVPLTQLVSGTQLSVRDQVSDELQLSINKMLGVDEETYKKFGGDASGSTN